MEVLTMYIVDGIAYAGELEKLIRVKSVRALDDYKLSLLFTNGERRIYDLKPFLDMPCYQALKDPELFRQAYIECGTVEWNEETDIAPETLYSDSVPVTDGKTA